MELLDLSATAIASALRKGDTTPLEVVDRHITRIEAVNPQLNAVVATRFEAARSEAKEAAEALAKAKKRRAPPPPLLGVPCTLKEFYAVAGMPNSAGIAARRDLRAQEDGIVAKRLRDAGAIVLGLTNAPEGGLWSETNNRVYGRTNNPWDTGRTPGGSSGGEAAILAAGGSPFGFGSDVGGSIRLPSTLCGIFGHKPTGRMVPLTGHFPPAEGEVGGMLCCGPMTRRAEDLMPLLRIAAGPDGVDPRTRPWTLGDPAAVDLATLRVFTCEDPGTPRVHEDVRRAVRHTGEALGNRGARVAPWSSPVLRDVFTIWGAFLETRSAGQSYEEELGGGRRVRLHRELLRYPLGRSDHISMALGVLLLERLMKWFPGGSKEGLVRRGQALQAELEELLGDDGILVFPAYTRTAPAHHAMILRPFDHAVTAIFNFCEFPATAVPVGFDANGLPLGVQVVARRGADHLCIAAALALEELFGGWVRAEPR